MGAGRPTEYNEKLHPKLVKMCYGHGMTNAEAAAYMGIALSTLHDWRNKYKKFSDAISEGKSIIDDEVENTLLKKAKGYKENAIKIFCNQGDVTKVDYIESYQPDYNSIRLWLMNRRPDKWRDKHEIDHKGEVTLNFDPQDKSL